MPKLKARPRIVHYRARGYLIPRAACGAQAVNPQHYSRGRDLVNCKACRRKLDAIADGLVDDLLRDGGR